MRYPLLHIRFAVTDTGTSRTLSIFQDDFPRRVTAIRGYFDEIFAEKVHLKELCVKTSDGSEVCVNGDQINTLLNNANIDPISVPDPISPPADSSSSMGTETESSIPNPEPDTSTETSTSTPETNSEPEQISGVETTKESAPVSEAPGSTSESISDPAPAE